MNGSQLAVDPASEVHAKARIGRLEGVDPQGRLLFREAGAGRPIAVLIGIDSPDEMLAQAAESGRRALVLPNEDGPPVLVALIRERIFPGTAPPVDAVLDGRTVRLTAEREIDLRCGKARLLLRRDGRVEIHGTHVLSSSTGPHRIKGATVALN